MSLHESFDVLCWSIYNIDKNIKSVAVINNKGKIVEKILKPEFAEQFPDYFNELFCMHHVLQISMGRDFDDHHGPVNYHISERANLITLTFPLHKNIMLVTTSKNVSPITLARKITPLIEKHRQPV